MRHRSLIALGMVFGLGLAVAAVAADKPLVAQGKIAHIDAKANTLTLAAGEEHVTFTLGANTAYTAFGKASTMARLRWVSRRSCTTRCPVRPAWRRRSRWSGPNRRLRTPSTTTRSPHRPPTDDSF